MSLIEKARAARNHAHAPYSGFKVGAALRTVSGRVYVGCNVENASYPEGTCAETGAIAAMVADGETQIAEVAIIADSPHPISPCGGCRQRLAEFAGDDTPVVMASLNGQQATATLSALLPAAFASGSMAKGR